MSDVYLVYLLLNTNYAKIIKYLWWQHYLCQHL